ncbi:pirin family protein [soil metagenome]
MLTIRRSEDRGRAEHGWLHSNFSFSFADYFDPKHMGFRALRVINDDIIDGGGGFGMHPHANMEIMSYVTAGALSHEDSMGNKGTIKPGQIQYMSAGKGVRHSEFNGSATEPAHLLQIWIVPDEKGTTPAYADKDVSAELATGGLTLLASRDGRDGSFATHADANVFAAKPKAGAAPFVYTPADGRALWIHVVKGPLDVNGTSLADGDGLAVEDEKQVTIAAKDGGEFLMFDLA